MHGVMLKLTYGEKVRWLVADQATSHTMEVKFVL